MLNSNRKKEKRKGHSALIVETLDRQIAAYLFLVLVFGFISTSKFKQPTLVSYGASAVPRNHLRKRTA